MINKFGIYTVLLLCNIHVFSQRGIFSTDILFGPTVYIFDKSEPYDFSQDFNYSYGIYLKYNVPIYKTTLSFRSGYYFEAKNYNRYFQTDRSWEIKQINSELLYGNIPLMIELKFIVKNRYSPFICFGYIMSNLISGKQLKILNNGEVNTDFSYKTELLDTPRDLYFSLGSDIGISKVLLMRIEIFYNQQLNGKSYWNRDKFGMSSYGLKVGLVLDFVFNKHKN